MTGSPEAIQRACAAAGAALAATRADQAVIANQAGPEAVAEWARPGGTEGEQATVARRYRELQRRMAGKPAA